MNNTIRNCLAIAGVLFLLALAWVIGFGAGIGYRERHIRSGRVAWMEEDKARVYDCREVRP